MPWNLNDIIAFGRQFSGPAGTELAFVFSEWVAEDGLALTAAYPAVRADLPPTEDAPANRAARLWVKLSGSAWQQVSSIANVTNIGIGSVGVLQSGVQAAMVIKDWGDKSIAAGYIVATGATLDQINTDRDEGIALIRTYINEDDGEDHPFAPSEPFTSGQVTALQTWLSDHSVTPAEFAALFDVSAAQIPNWLQTHTRAEFAQVIHNRFT